MLIARLLRTRPVRGLVKLIRKLQPTSPVGLLRTRLMDLPAVDLASLSLKAPVMILAPHPDDETLGCGGIVAEACLRGLDVWVFVLTDGTGSHPGSASYPPDRLKALREGETLDAVTTLGLPPERVIFLGYRDGAAPRFGTDFRRAADRLALLAREHHIKTICTTWKHDPHPDHKAAYRLARAVTKSLGARLLCYPIWLWDLPDDSALPAERVTGYRVDIARHLDIKRSAIACHRSQTTRLITDDDGHTPLTEAFLRHFERPYEVLIES